MPLGVSAKVPFCFSVGSTQLGHILF